MEIVKLSIITTYK